MVLCNVPEYPLGVCQREELVNEPFHLRVDSHPRVLAEQIALLFETEALRNFSFGEIPPSDKVLFFCGCSEACGHPVLTCKSSVTSVGQVQRHKLHYVWVGVVFFHPLFKFAYAALEETFPVPTSAYVEMSRVLFGLVAVRAS